MPPRVESALYVLGAIAVFWAAVSYANHMVVNIRAGLWIGAVVDGVIWAVGLALFMWLVREAGQKWK